MITLVITIQDDGADHVAMHLKGENIKATLQERMAAHELIEYAISNRCPQKPVTIITHDNPKEKTQ